MGTEAVAFIGAGYLHDPRICQVMRRQAKWGIPATAPPMDGRASGRVRFRRERRLCSVAAAPAAPMDNPDEQPRQSRRTQSGRRHRDGSAALQLRMDAYAMPPWGGLNDDPIGKWTHVDGKTTEVYDWQLLE